MRKESFFFAKQTIISTRCMLFFSFFQSLEELNILFSFFILPFFQPTKICFTSFFSASPFCNNLSMKLSFFTLFQCRIWPKNQKKIVHRQIFRRHCLRNHQRTGQALPNHWKLNYWHHQRRWKRLSNSFTRSHRTNLQARSWILWALPKEWWC